MSIYDVTVTRKFHFGRSAKGRKEMAAGTRLEQPTAPAGRVPRISRLMALAIRFAELIKSGAVVDQAELARLGHVTRARLTQVMNLVLLAPDIQEQLLFMPVVLDGHDPLCEQQIRAMATEVDWDKQRELWQALKPPLRTA